MCWSFWMRRPISCLELPGQHSRGSIFNIAEHIVLDKRQKTKNFMVSVQIKVPFPLYMQTRKKTERKEVERMKRRFAAGAYGLFHGRGAGGSSQRGADPRSQVRTRAILYGHNGDLRVFPCRSWRIYQRHYGAVVWKRSEVIWTGRDTNRLDMSKTHHRAERTDLHAEGFLHGQRRDHKASPHHQNLPVSVPQEETQKKFEQKG